MGYAPGEQPPPGTKIIKLNTNENPYPPSPKALHTTQSVDPEVLRRYPDPCSKSVCEAVKKNLDVPAEWVIAANGSDELLSMVVRACAGPGRPVVYPMPTYVLYRTLAQIQDAQHVEIPFDNDYNLPFFELVAAQGAVTFIASPNSPSGTLIPVSLLGELASKLKGVLVIDEAYADFAEINALRLIRDHHNILILRTLSKGYSMAGLRLGFGIAQPDLLKGLFKVKDSYNVNALTCIVGAAAIDDQAHKDTNVEKIRRSRASLATDLAALGFRVWPSQANFLLVRPPAGDAESIYIFLKEHGILVRYFKQPRLEDKLRISMGTDEQNRILVRTISEYLDHSK